MKFIICRCSSTTLWQLLVHLFLRFSSWLCLDVSDSCNRYTVVHSFGGNPFPMPAVQGRQGCRSSAEWFARNATVLYHLFMRQLPHAWPRSNRPGARVMRFGSYSYRARGYYGIYTCIHEGRSWKRRDREVKMSGSGEYGGNSSYGDCYPVFTSDILCVSLIRMLYCDSFSSIGISFV